MQKQKIVSLIEEGEKVLDANRVLPSVEPTIVPLAAFETWMGKINTFNERYLKKHPMHDSIFTCYFHRKNTASKCYEMIGLLKAVESDEDLWGAASNESSTEKSEEKAMSTNKRIFISHRTCDKKVADMLCDYFVALGVNSEAVFCSSLPGNDVKEKISVEVKEALKESALNVAILSKAYYESAYCLNEAGILWYNDTKVLVIGLDDIQHSDMIGFLNDDYKIRRLDNSTDVAHIADMLQELELIPKQKIETIWVKAQKLMQAYKEYKSSPQESFSKARLFVRGITESGNLDDNAHFQTLRLNTAKDSENMVEEIRSLIHRISQIKIDAIAPIVRGLGSSRVEVSEGMKSAIDMMSELLEITLPSDFYFVGSLSEAFRTANNLLGARQYQGSKEEIEKFTLLEKLYLKIEELNEWLPVENAFRDIKCIKLALTNSGTAPDEDIDVTFRIPRKAYKTIKELPSLNEDTMEYIVRECDLSELLGIGRTAEYDDYNSTWKSQNHAPIYSGYKDPFSRRDYSEEYLDELKDALWYDVYEERDDYVLKVKFDYLKHNTTAAFPAVILVKERVSIKYEIASQNSPDVIKGIISIV